MTGRTRKWRGVAAGGLALTALGAGVGGVTGDPRGHPRRQLDGPGEAAAPVPAR